ncbi:hypothetical protein Pla110_44740 [Polystyrenella longa]|uniref:Uncharacterized protein n=1 Tax=Polystyrenella longa TaxID=2528007 RepID=A0A518CU09_9PLAN|nr:hypothetical protein [Polystyrenella longa]QDU82712.1 hypothetical protein Pla110_44740 [Polystyrenella longa]
MSHSHMPMIHLVKQAELYKAKRQQRDSRPAWLIELIDSLTDLFEPMSDVGRVGFDCQFDEGEWKVSLFLGQTEFVGGLHDGLSRPTNYQFNILPLLDLISDVEKLDYIACPDENLQTALEVESHITIRGQHQGNPLQLHILSTAPHQAGPGIRQFPNGAVDAI